MVMRIAFASPMLVATFTKKNCILVIFGKFKKRNPRVVGFFHRILDRNVVVQQQTTQEANVEGDVLQDALILALDNTSDYWVVESGDLLSCYTPQEILS